MVGTKMTNRFIFPFLFIILCTGCRSSILDDPTTRISYTVEQPSHVKLVVENSYNTVIAVPVDNDLAIGTYSVNINSSFWLEGEYFYTIECKGLNSDYYSKTTKALLLIK